MRVLGVDDEALARESLIRMLAAEPGVEVVGEAANGLQALDGPHAVLEDEAGLRASARRALAHNYDDKWVIHPEQIAPVNEVFTPTDEELARAERILAAGGGALRHEGELVDLASRRLAEALLARGRAARR